MGQYIDRPKISGGDGVRAKDSIDARCHMRPHRHAGGALARPKSPWYLFPRTSTKPFMAAIATYTCTFAHGRNGSKIELARSLTSRYVEVDSQICEARFNRA